MFLKNKNIIFIIRRSKVTDYAALNNNVAKLLTAAVGLNKILPDLVPKFFVINTSQQKCSIVMTHVLYLFL